jgi:CDP-diacylglycerol--glycerol-3-phosphate 3-phosphatidyltransferase
MNLPNRLTVIRIIATPVFMYTMVASFKYHFVVALLIFIGASLTDLFDGKIARSRGLVTNFGKFLDPLADKMLTTAAFLGLLLMRYTEGIVWIVFLILFREFAITSMRLVCSSSGKVVAANMWGKVKTVVQMVTIIAILAIEGLKSIICETTYILPDSLVSALSTVTAVLLWATAALTVVSGVVYLWQNRDVVDPSK